MNGIHDVGGMEGLGPVHIPEDEPVFYAPWEADVFSTIGLMFAGGACPLDFFRHTIERMDAVEYLETPYYVHWLRAAETISVEMGLMQQQEIEDRMALLQAKA